MPKKPTVMLYYNTYQDRTPLDTIYQKVHTPLSPYQLIEVFQSFIHHKIDRQQIITHTKAPLLFKQLKESIPNFKKENTRLFLITWASLKFSWEDLLALPEKRAIPLGIQHTVLDKINRNIDKFNDEELISILIAFNKLGLLFLSPYAKPTAPQSYTNVQTSRAYELYTSMLTKLLILSKNKPLNADFISFRNHLNELSSREQGHLKLLFEKLFVTIHNYCLDCKPSTLIQYFAVDDLIKFLMPGGILPDKTAYKPLLPSLLAILFKQSLNMDELLLFLTWIEQKKNYSIFENILAKNKILHTLMQHAPSLSLKQCIEFFTLWGKLGKRWSDIYSPIIGPVQSILQQPLVDGLEKALPGSTIEELGALLYSWNQMGEKIDDLRIIHLKNKNSLLNQIVFHANESLKKQEPLHTVTLLRQQLTLKFFSQCTEEEKINKEKVLKLIEGASDIASIILYLNVHKRHQGVCDDELIDRLLKKIAAYSFLLSQALYRTALQAGIASPAVRLTYMGVCASYQQPNEMYVTYQKACRDNHYHPQMPSLIQRFIPPHSLFAPRVALMPPSSNVRPIPVYKG